ncbi:MAG: PIN domain-containing protein [Lachnospiraceae bacterium]|jgi:hypothetical protein|nr:PIN domain-containing protein [Lachnospiraceae bacterium]
MRIYFDNCCLNRPYDDLTNNTVRMECEAILSIIDTCRTSNWSYFSSDILLDEILVTTDNDKREKVMLLYNAAMEHISFTEAILRRAKELENFNVKSFDALHAASAEAAKADVLLTTDCNFINAAKRAKTHVPVKNPLVWLVEVLYDWES